MGDQEYDYRDAIVCITVEALRAELDRVNAINAALQAQLTEAHEAVHWLWGFWDGNTLIPHTHDAALQEDIQEAFERCIRAVEDGR